MMLRQIGWKVKLDEQSSESLQFLLMIRMIHQVNSHERLTLCSVGENAPFLSFYFNLKHW